MPVRKVNGGYRWGSSGKVYPNKSQAERQGRAIYASGYAHGGQAGNESVPGGLQRIAQLRGEAEMLRHRGMQELIPDVLSDVGAYLDSVPGGLRRIAQLRGEAEMLRQSGSQELLEQLTPTSAQAAWFAGQLPWGMGTADIAGKAPGPPSSEASLREAFSGAHMRSLRENIRQGDYWPAAGQALGGAADILQTIPFLAWAGTGIKATKAGAELATQALRGIARLPEAAKVAETVKPPDVARLGDFPTTTPGRIVHKTKDKGGYTVNLPTGDVPESGLMVGNYPNVDPRNVVLGVEDLNRKAIQAHAQQNAKVLARQDSYLGTWFNPDEGKVYLDVSTRFDPDDIRKATVFGERTGQMAGFDIEKMSDFPIGNWREYILTPELTHRMDEMAAVGRAYLDRNMVPGREWWDIRGTIFEEIYGPELMRSVAGFTSATAPNTQLRENLQSMSEYMRRAINGEPIVQPDWRVPEDAVFRTPGTQIGMEKSKAANLRAVERGALDELSAGKIRNMAAAMLDDPDAVVLDRYWARIAENPEKGVFTASAEGIVPQPTGGKGLGEQYDLLKDRVIAAAMRAERTPRDYSADVWTGIRETIKNDSELFGVKYKKGSIKGPSMGFADLLEVMLDEKAKLLNISVSELKARLGRGDANLLSMMLASPVVYAVFSQLEEGAPVGNNGAST